MLIISGLFWLLCSLILYTYFIYPVLLSVFGSLKTACKSSPDLLPVVSLVMSAYNEEKVIRDKIENSLALDYPKDKLEILFASDGSDDKTDAIISEYASVVSFVRISPRAGKVNALNRLIPASKGEIVVLSDANTMFEHNALRALVSRFADTGVGCVCGRLVLRSPVNASGGEIEGLYWKYENSLKVIEGEMGVLLGANGGIYGFRKELFRPLPPDTICDDFVLPMTILMRGHKVVYAAEAVGVEETSSTIEEEQTRKIRIGAGAYQAFFRLLPMINPLRGLPSLVYWSHKVLRWMVPFFMLALIPLSLLLIRKPVYNVIALAQALLYAGALIGYISDRKARFFKPFHVLYYFVSMNASLFRGFIRFISKTQKVTWQRVAR